MKHFFLLLFIYSFSPHLHSQWIPLGNIPFDDNHSNGFGYNGKAYIIQGSPQSNEDYNSYWEYDPASDSWSELGKVPGPSRSVAIGDDMDGKYYFGFGRNKSDLWEYDPSIDKFTELTPCPCEGRAHPAFVAHKGKIYMGSGTGTNTDLKDWWIYDLETHSWIQKADIPGERRHHPFQFGIDDAIYVGGGHDDTWSKWDINTETWTEIDNFNKDRIAGTQFSHNGKGFVLGGDEQDHIRSAEEGFVMYSPEQDIWTPLPFEEDMHSWAPSSFIIDDIIYYFGGRGPLNTRMYKFDLSSVDCLPPTELIALNITESLANIYWIDSPSGEADSLQWREEGDIEWTTVVNPKSVHTIDNLKECTVYEFRVNTICEEISRFSRIKTFRTKGCGACTDLNYCDFTMIEFQKMNIIRRVKINNYEKNDDVSTQLYQFYYESGEQDIPINSIVNIELEKNTAFEEFPASFHIWLDLNLDGVFADNELVFSNANHFGDLYTEFTIPENTQIGLSRMRIITNLFGNITSACNDDGEIYGLVEDYCISVVDEFVDVEHTPVIDNNIKFSPNPSNSIFVIENITSSNFSIQIFNVIGNLVYSTNSQESIDLGNLNNGIYIAKVYDNELQSEIAISKLIKH